MKRYKDPKNDRYQFLVRETLNGYSIEVLIVPTGKVLALTLSNAASIHVTIPKPYRLQSCTEEAAEKQLDELAALNGWAAIE